MATRFGSKMTVSHHDIQLLVCPSCHGQLVREEERGLHCLEGGHSYPARAEIDVLLDSEEWAACLRHLEEELEVVRQYSRIRRRSPLNQMYYDWWVSRMLALAPEHPSGPLLELMCGEAEVCRRLPDRFTRAVALDLNVRLVEAAQHDLAAACERRVELACGTATRLPLEDRSIGVVVIQGGLHHVRRSLAEVLDEVARVLRPDGILIASEPANDNVLIRAIRHWQYRRSRMQGHDPDEDGFTREQLRRELGRAGLRLERYLRFGYVAYPLLGTMEVLPLLSGISTATLGRALMGLDALLERLPLVRGLAFASLFSAVPD